MPVALEECKIDEHGQSQKAFMTEWGLIRVGALECVRYRTDKTRKQNYLPQLSAQGDTDTVCLTSAISGDSRADPRRAREIE